jgi:hypothetical protein
MLDLPDILAHVSHADTVQGGALLFGGGRIEPLLSAEEFLDDRKRGAGRLNPGVVVERSPRGNRARHSANSAEGIRAIMQSLGVKPRPPTDVPVDVWSRN